MKKKLPVQGRGPVTIRISGLNAAKWLIRPRVTHVFCEFEPSLLVIGNAALKDWYIRKNHSVVWREPSSHSVLPSQSQLISTILFNHTINHNITNHVYSQCSSIFRAFNLGGRGSNSGLTNSRPWIWRLSRLLLQRNYPSALPQRPYLPTSLY